MTGRSGDARIGELLRELAPVVLAATARRYPGFDLCEDAVQEALLAASLQWPVDGLPSNPRGWLVTAASRRWIETYRSDTARRRREDGVAAASVAPTDSTDRDDELTLFFLCCHPVLTTASQVALTLRAVGGLTTAEIARALLVPEPTVAQRISRAKARIRRSGASFALPDEADRDARLAAVLQVLYLVFTEGHTASSGSALHRVELSTEAIRLMRQLRRAQPGVGEVAGLLALMLLTDARRAARTTSSGALIPLSEQDRTRWDRAMITEGTALLTDTLATSTMGPYQLQAAIAAVHGDARTAADTDWCQILGLYDILLTMAGGPAVVLSRIVALAMVEGPAVGLRALSQAGLAELPRATIVRAHLLEQSGRTGEAHQHYLLAAGQSLNLPEREYLQSKADSTATAPSDR